MAAGHQLAEEGVGQMAEVVDPAEVISVGAVRAEAISVEAVRVEAVRVEAISVEAVRVEAVSPRRARAAVPRIRFVRVHQAFPGQTLDVSRFPPRLLLDQVHHDLQFRNPL